MARFKVGDRVVCIKDQKPHNITISDVGIISRIGVGGYDYLVDFKAIDLWPMNENELAHDKEYQVLTILRNYKNEKGISKLP